MSDFLKKYSGIVLFMFAYWFICLIMLFAGGSFLYAMLAWNTLLAVLPLFFINKAEISDKQGKTGRSILWMILWLLFFPNSVYMVTDFIHISGDKFMWIVEAEKYSSNRGVVYSTDIIIWAKLLVIGIGFIFSLFVGLESLHIFEQNIKKKFSRPACWSGVLTVALLSAIGVYIGRFLRFNSWDVLFRPVKLLEQVIAKLDGFTVQFIIIFFLFEICSYILYKTLRGTINQKN
ncbi:MAG TPA: DUF1361 domain-containing protein [Clostridiaceae bacterium]|nr:DUF1361 domain-containing protein [Clostridiaceae bacterium]